MKILAVDDEQVALSSIRRLLRRRGFSDVATCDNGAEAIEQIRKKDFDIVLLDILMPKVDGLKVLEATKPHKPGTEFIIVSAIEDIATTVKAIRLGAYDYLIKPTDPDRLQLTIERAFERKGLKAGQAGSASASEAREIPESFSAVITRNPRMIELIRFAVTIARSRLPVLITGESGTGKELFARGIHAAERDQGAPFVAVNVTAVPESLFESQFFGHVRGAFTDATADHVGYFQQADGGTLYMDEIGELPGRLQVKFLRVLEENSVSRLGEKKATAVDLRIVSSTNADLETACAEGRFRLDLYYRINSGVLHLPPLRERSEDIPLLAEHYLSLASRRFDKPIEGFSRAAMEALQAREYPGNVRELIGVVNSAALRCDSDRIQPEHLGAEPRTLPDAARELCTLKENTERHVAFVYSRTGGNPARMSEILGVSVRQVQRRLAEMRQTPEWSHLFGGK